MASECRDSCNVCMYVVRSFVTDGAEADNAGRGLAFLWEHLSFDELLHSESVTSQLREKTPFANCGLHQSCIANIGSAMQVHQVRVVVRDLCE